MRVDLAIIAGPGIKKTFDKLRNLSSFLLKLNIMFCGLPISLGQKSLLFVSQTNPAEILTELDQLIFIKGAGIFTSILLNLFFRHIFPAREEIQPSDIYNSRYKANNSTEQTDHFQIFYH